MASNLAGTSGNVQKRQFLLQGTDFASSPNPFHSPTLPASPIAEPSYPGTLNAAERAEVQKYLANPTPETLASLTLRAAIDKAREYATYYADPSVIAWRAAVYEADISQRFLTRADALINNESTTSVSADPTGVGSTPPPAYQPPGTNTP
jgi:hypothetical protein